jgi:hypothetical protein
MKDKTHHILERFPDKSHSLKNLMKEDPDFLSICEDHEVCVNALGYWEKSMEPEAETRVHEYRILVKELEAEIAAALTMQESMGSE